ncbi:MAG TPA: AAA family ATPase [Acidimicrobiales bacterium]|jgi:magnesium chelatase subunit D|nr:AAA family ATPase [Acidimicrobiales bacterium]
MKGEARRVDPARRFPFSAVVGLEEARLALLLGAIDPAIGGVLLRGPQGSARSTLARGLAGLLPGSPRFVDLPVGATEDRVLGSLDIMTEAIDGETRFRAGLLASAHGGVLYVNAVNLLPEHLVDLLLGVAAAGVNRVERNGVWHEHPARFVLVASLNPDDGELPPQLLDRFGLAVEVKAPADPETRAEVVRRRLTHDAGGEVHGYDADILLRARLAAAMPADLPTSVVDFASHLAVGLGVEGLRGDLVLCRAAAALAGWEGRSVTTESDVERVAPLALGHRRRPFDPPTLPADELERALAAAREALAAAEVQPDADGDAGEDADADTDTTDSSVQQSGWWATISQQGTGGDLGDEPGEPEPESDRSDEVPEVLDPAEPTADDAELATGTQSAIAVAPTVQAVTERQENDEPNAAQAVGRTVVVAVDASGSLGVARRVEAATGAVLGLLGDAHMRNDRVALVTFRGDAASEILPPTASVELAHGRLEQVPTGGLAPLAEGLATALATARRAVAEGSAPLLVVITDGRATGDLGALDRARGVAADIASAAIEAMVIDAEDGPAPLGLAKQLATSMRARCVRLGEISAPQVEAAVREALAG